MAAHFAFLGTSAAVPSAVRDTTSLVFVTAVGAVLVDCGGGPIAKLRRAAVDPLALSHVVITHMHPDHAYGLPSLLQNLILLGRRAGLTVACRSEHSEPLRDLLRVFRLWERPGMFPLTLAPVSLDASAPAFVVGPLSFGTAPNDHGAMPNFALRVDVEARPAAAVVYSSDTLPCDGVVALARGAHTLIHDATFPHRDRGRFGAHSTAREAGDIAARAGVRRLILTHIDAAYHDELPALAGEAAQVFGGRVEIAEEFVPYPLG